MTMSNPLIRETVEDAFSGLHFLNSRGNGGYLERLHKMEVSSQRKHLEWQGETPSKVFPTPLIAKYFVVRCFINAVRWVNFDEFRPRDLLHFKESYLLALALADEYSEEVKAWAETVPEYFDDIDYSSARLYERGKRFDPRRAA